MSNKAFIFDLDGTLVDAYPAIIRTFNFTMGRLKVRAQRPEVIRKAVGWGDIQLLEPFVAKEDLPRAISIYRRHHLVMLKKYARLMPHAKPLLSCLKANGYKLAIASNRPTRFTLFILRHLHINGFFDRVLCADKLKFGKPHPLILRRLLQDLKVSRRDTYYVGDMALDVATGKRAGIATIAVATGSSSMPELKKAGPSRLYKDLKVLRHACAKNCDCYRP